MMNRVAVIVSMYKNDTLAIVKEMFASLENQTVQAFDIFVQEDGPLEAALHHYLLELKAAGNIAYLGMRNDNRGLAYSLNELVEVVLKRGYEYIVRMDSDDICVPERIGAQQMFLDRYKDIDTVGGWIEEFNTDTGARQVVSYPAEHDAIRAHACERNPMAHVTVMYRRAFFEKVGRYNAGRYNEDYELWLRGFEEGAKFANLQKVLVEVRTNNAFFERRRHFERALEVMMLKIHATRTFGCGIRGYLFAVAHFALFMAPGFVKKIVYKYLR